MPPQLTPVSDTSDVKRDGPVLAVSWPTQGCRPGYKGKEDPPGAPDILDFAKMPVILKDLPEDRFRNTIVQTALQVRDLGLNRDKGKERAQAYLDMATWDDNYRSDWTNDNSLNSSSCGMVVRNILWLCGLRGLNLFDSPYGGGILDHLIDMDKKEACKRWASGFTSKKFFPKIGDVLFLTETGTRHIFTICGIDKEIVDEGGVATVYDVAADGTRKPASEITFTSVDGGQSDGLGKDGRGASKNWGCQGIQKVSRKMALKDGHFLDIGVKWRFPDGQAKRPIHTWISTWELREKFTAQWIKPLRLGAMNDGGAGGSSNTHVEPHGDSGDSGSNILGSNGSNHDPGANRDAWMAQHYFLSMADLLAAIERLGRTEAQATRDRYVAADNPNKGKWGLRPQVALDACLHKNEGSGAAWIFDQLRFAQIYPETHRDQYQAVGRMIGLEYHDNNIA